MTDLTIIDLAGPADDADLVARTYRTVLRPSFNGDELAGPEMVVPGAGRVLTVALDPAGEPMAAAVTEFEPGVTLLAYLAASPRARGVGAGGRLMAHLSATWRARQVPLVLAEVHDPRGHAETDDEHPEARLRFYARAGATVLDVPWVQPALSPSATRVPDMLLLVLHRAKGLDPDAVPSAPLVQWARDYFDDAEGVPPEDPQAAALLARLAADERIAVLPLDRWRHVAPLSLT